MAAYYNEIDPYVAKWLRNLIDAGHIAPGDVDTRSIEDVCPDDLRPYTQCHFFAGVGVWSYALRGVGWSDDRPIWTGSCPCQPFSSAGQGVGFDDERHLWPALFHLAAQCRPKVICGEQVASKDGRAWLDLVQSDLEGLGYAAWAIIIPVAGVGAPHERHRSWWVGIDEVPDASSGGRRIVGHAAQSGGGGYANSGFEASGMGDANGGQRVGGQYLSGRYELVRADTGRPQNSGDVGAYGNHGRVGDADQPRPQGYAGNGDGGGRRPHEVGSTAPASIPSGLADAAYSDGRAGECPTQAGARPDSEWGRRFAGGGLNGGMGHNEGPGPTNGFWRNADWIFCTDGKWRPVEPGTFPLAYGLARSMGAVGAGLRGLCDMAGVDGNSLKRAKRYRTGSLKGYGNAISPEPAMAFIDAWMTLAP